jgi:hypothetical protein
MKISPLDRTVKSPGVAGSVYEPPILKVFGPVGNLTQAGSGVMSEVMIVGPVGMEMCVDSGSLNHIDAMC